MTVLVGVLGLVMTYFLAKNWFGRSVALLATLLMSTSPSWIFWSRIGVYVVSEVVPIGAGALLALSVWAKRRPLGTRNWPLYIGMGLLGLGLATKLLFLWFLTSIPICAVLLFGRQIWEARGLVARFAQVGANCLPFGRGVLRGSVPLPPVQRDDQGHMVLLTCYNPRGHYFARCEQFGVRAQPVDRGRRLQRCSTRRQLLLVPGRCRSSLRQSPDPARCSRCRRSALSRCCCSSTRAADANHGGDY